MFAKCIRGEVTWLCYLEAEAHWALVRCLQSSNPTYSQTLASVCPTPPQYAPHSWCYTRVDGFGPDLFQWAGNSVEVLDQTPTDLRCKVTRPSACYRALAVGRCGC